MSEGTASWIADLPEDLRGNPALSSFKGNDWKEVGPVLAKSFVETKSLTGKKAYDLPKEDWKPEQWNEWHKTIGVPESPDKYSEPPEEMISKAGLNKETLAAAKKRFHELGLTQKQVKGLMDEWYIPTAISGAELTAKQQEQERLESAQKLESELTQMYGDKKDAKLGLVKAFLSKFGSNELVEWADKTGAGNDPGFVKTLIKAGEALLESSSRHGSGGTAELGPDAAKAAALKEIEDMMAKRINDPKYADAFNDPRSAERKRWTELHDLAYKKQ